MSCELVIDIVYTTTDFDAPNSPESRKVWVATVFSKPVSLGRSVASRAIITTALCPTRPDPSCCPHSCGCFLDRLSLPDYSERVGSFEIGKVYK